MESIRIGRFNETLFMYERIQFSYKNYGDKYYTELLKTQNTHRIENNREKKRRYCLKPSTPIEVKKSLHITS